MFFLMDMYSVLFIVKDCFVLNKGLRLDWLMIFYVGCISKLIGWFVIYVKFFYVRFMNENYYIILVVVIDNCFLVL